MGIRPLLRRSLLHIPDLVFHVHAAPTNIYRFFNGGGILKSYMYMIAFSMIATKSNDVNDMTAYR